MRVRWPQLALANCELVAAELSEDFFENEATARPGMGSSRAQRPCPPNVVDEDLSTFGLSMPGDGRLSVC